MERFTPHLDFLHSREKEAAVIAPAGNPSRQAGDRTGKADARANGSRLRIVLGRVEDGPDGIVSLAVTR